MNGLHLTADCADCACDLRLLTDAARLRDWARALVDAVGLQVVDACWHSFAPSPEPGGVTGVLLLAESHLAIHTWPELRGATLDVHVCHFGADNSAKARALMAALLQGLKPGKLQEHTVLRGWPSPASPT
jgi:S-adenosylmethionine decarboxylase proenzyme